jgi:hypothetical protein
VAIDARLVAAAPDAGDVRTEGGEAVAVEQAVRRFPSAQLLLGRPQMAGVVLHVKEAELRRAYATSDLAALRIRSLLPPPAADPHGARDLVVRLGIAGDVPLTLERIQVVSLEGRPWITRADASLCGPDADPVPLAVSLIGRAAEAPDGGAATDPAPSVGPIVPSMAVRHASDDLCIRWWGD